MRIQRLLMGICALLLMSICAPAALAAEQETPYVATVYNERSGLPTGEANVVLQTSDGYIWIGSYGGLIRYDGSTFRNFSKEGALKSSSIRSLYEDSAGRLWIGSNDAGVFLYENGQFCEVPCTRAHSFLCIRDFAEGPDGTVYAASNSGVGSIRDGRLVPYEDEAVDGQTVYSLGVDRYGRLWAAMNYGVCAVLENGGVKDTVPSSLIFEGDEEVYCLTGDRQGNLYFGTAGTVLAKVTCDGPRLDPTDLTVEYRRLDSTATHNQIRVTDAGDILVAGQQGFAWIAPDGAVREFGEAEYAASLNSAAMDYEGNFWLASSSNGLIKYNRGCFTTPNGTAGLDGLAVNAVAAAGDAYYIARDQGVLAFDRAWNPVENDLTALLSGLRVRHVLGDSRGRLWCATYSAYGVVCYDPRTGEIQCFNQDSGLGSSRARVLLELSDGSIAAGTQDGLGIIKDGAVVRTYGKEDGLENLAILCLTQAADGTLLAGSDGDGIYAIRDGRVTNHSFSKGLHEGVVLRILEDADGGGYFVSAGSSLYYWKDDAFVKLENFQKDAGSIFDFYDRDGKLWLLQNNGVLAVDKAQLLAGEEALTISYGVNHGLTGSLNANTWNYLAPDGQLYMATRSGVSVFAFHGVDIPLPKTIVNSIRIDDTVYEHPQTLSVSSGVQRITVDFAALSYAGTGNLRLAYYLEGFDQKETILDDRFSGTISYTNLPGGDYVFHLRVFDPLSPGVESSCGTAIHKDKQLSEYTAFWLAVVAVLLALAAGTAHLYSRAKMNRLRQRQQEYQQIVDQSLQTFAKTIDAKDRYTNGHSIRVAWYSREIARRMGFSPEEQERIYYVALLHDIGKIGIPDQILNKEGRLTEEESKIVRTHPALGGDILKNFTALEGISEGARYHHERYDGKGYCTGKAGKDIPQVARIIGVADSYDAMASDRCYRKAMSQEVIARELRKGSGTQFDPEVVPVMLEMMEDGTAPVAAPPDDPS